MPIESLGYGDIIQSIHYSKSIDHHQYTCSKESTLSHIGLGNDQSFHGRVSGNNKIVLNLNETMRDAAFSNLSLALGDQEMTVNLHHLNNKDYFDPTTQGARLIVKIDQGNDGLKMGYKIEIGEVHGQDDNSYSFETIRRGTVVKPPTSEHPNRTSIAFNHKTSQTLDSPLIGGLRTIETNNLADAYIRSKIFGYTTPRMHVCYLIHTIAPSRPKPTPINSDIRLPPLAPPPPRNISDITADSGEESFHSARSHFMDELRLFIPPKIERGQPGAGRVF